MVPPFTSRSLTYISWRMRTERTPKTTHTWLPRSRTHHQPRTQKPTGHRLTVRERSGEALKTADLLFQVSACQPASQTTAVE